MLCDKYYSHKQLLILWESLNNLLLRSDGRGRGDLKRLRFYNILLVFDDLFGCLGQVKEGVRNDPSCLARKTEWIMIFPKIGNFPHS